MASGTAGSRPVARRNRDAQILEAAVRIFADKGYSGTSLQDVADAVGLLKGSLYHYISSKQSLLYRILEEAHEEATALMDSLDELHLPVHAHLEELVKRLTLFYLADTQRARVYFNEWRYLTGQERTKVLRQRRAFEDYIRQAVQHAREAGVTRQELDVDIATFYLLAAVNGVLTWYRPGGPLSADRIATEVAMLSCSGVLTGGQRGSSSRKAGPARTATTRRKGTS
ncbi:MAG: TetR/AcrR family transcriptional regulator [Mycobacteriales bacterium]